MKLILAALLFVNPLLSFANHPQGDLKVKDEHVDAISWRPITDLKNNEVKYCQPDIKDQCHKVLMPKEIGSVQGVVSGEFNSSPDTWLAFTKTDIYFCLAKGMKASCAFAGKKRQGGVLITYDEQSKYPSLIYRSRSNNAEEVKLQMERLVERMLEAKSKLHSNRHDEMSVIKDCTSPGCDIRPSPSIEDGDGGNGGIATVYVTAPFPAISIVDGAFQMLPVSFGDSGPTVPDPLPDGVAPSDYTKARDPAGMVACTAWAYKTYLIMVGGCTDHLPYYSRYTSCLNGAMRSYKDLLMNECYAKYF